MMYHFKGGTPDGSSVVGGCIRQEARGRILGRK
jgi:hypothetical protein